MNSVVTFSKLYLKKFMTSPIVIGLIIVTLFILSKWTVLESSHVHRLMMAAKDWSNFGDDRNRIPSEEMSNDSYFEYIHPQCGCTKLLPTRSFSHTKNSSRISTCSDEATLFGPGQKVISFSLYGNYTTEKTYYNIGFWPNLNAMRAVYPGWVMRIYSDYNISNIKSEYCEFICKNNDVFWCDSRNLPRLGNQSNLFGVIWRFLPMIDPLVDIFISRDLDSRLGIKEASAVSDWMESDKIIHIMRDHTGHRVPMLAGMWGLKNEADNITQNIMKAAVGVTRKGFDQDILEDLVYIPRYYNTTMAHDSVYCSIYSQTLCIPFPPSKQRSEYYVPFVGDVIVP